MRKKSRKKGSIKMAVLTAKCDRIFTVADDKSDLFFKQKVDDKIQKKMDNAVSKISKNIIMDDSKDEQN